MEKVRRIARTIYGAENVDFSVTAKKQFERAEAVLRQLLRRSPIVGGRSSANRLRRFDSLSRRPEGLLVLPAPLEPAFADQIRVELPDRTWPSAVWA